MALAYPEGECFFNVDGFPTKENYTMGDPKKFYGNMMIEYITNVEADHGQLNTNFATGYTHPRSGYHIVRGSGWKTDYGCWDQLPIQYGPTESTVKRRVQHSLCINGNIFRDHEKGQSAQSSFMVVPLPTAAERWIWIDLLVQIRAIYIPVSHTASMDYPKLSYWVQINFALDRKVDIWRGGETFSSHTCGATYGLQTLRTSAIGFDITGLISLLTLPRPLRAKSAYAFKKIKMVDMKDTITAPFSTTTAYNFSSASDYDWTLVAKANFGLDIQWVPATKGSWIGSFLSNVIAMALGFIPGVGPIIACVFTLGWTAMFNTDEFFDQLRVLLPAIDLGAELVELFKQSAEESKKLLPAGWEGYMPPPLQIGRAGSVEEVGEVLRDLETLGMGECFKFAKGILEKDGVQSAIRVVDEEGGEESLYRPPTAEV